MDVSSRKPSTLTRLAHHEHTWTAIIVVLGILLTILGFGIGAGAILHL
jgi:hypothetical protein